MNPKRPSLAALVTAILALSCHAPGRHGQSCNAEIISNDYYPQLRDAWMFRINNQGLAAGYIATAAANGPYLPTTIE